MIVPKHAEQYNKKSQTSSMIQQQKPLPQQSIGIPGKEVNTRTPTQGTLLI
jgi:hypothetical protein